MRSVVPGLILAALFLASAKMAAAGQATPDATPGGGGLPKVVWQLTEAALADGTVHTPDDPSLYTIQFLPEGRVTARTDCNHASGSYQVDGDSLQLSPLMTTLVGCPEGSLGSDYTAWLDQVVSFELTEEELILSLDDGGTLRFAPALVGVSWQWQTYQGGDDSEVAPEHPENFTLRFAANARVQVRADCNTGSGSALVDAASIDLERIALTRRYCGDDSLDQEYVQYLTDVTSYTFAGGKLVLVLPMDAGVLIFEARAIDDESAPTAAGTPASD